MSENVLKCTPEETKACCCADVGTIIDNSELSVDFLKSMKMKQQLKRHWHI